MGLSAEQRQQMAARWAGILPAEPEPEPAPPAPVLTAARPPAVGSATATGGVDGPRQAARPPLKKKRPKQRLGDKAGEKAATAGSVPSTPAASRR